MESRIFASIKFNRALLLSVAALALLLGASGCQNKPLLLRNRPNVPPPLLDPDDTAGTLVAPNDNVQALPTLVDTTFATPQVPTTEKNIQPPVIKAEPLTYTVLPHDTFWKIARMYGVTQRELASCNNMSLTKPLKVGVVLLIPPGGALQPGHKVSASPSKPVTRPHVRRKPPKKHVTRAAVDTQPTGPGGTYVVKPHDSLWKIANIHHVSLKALEQANNIDPKKPIRPGMKLVIPGHGGGTSTGASTLESPPDEITLDMPTTKTPANNTQPLDDSTLLRDAANAASGKPSGKDNLDDVFDSNSDTVNLDKAAKIAEDAAHPQKYMEMQVLPEDTLQSLAEKHNVSPETIRKLNPDAFLKNGHFKPFSTIKIPTL